MVNRIGLNGIMVNGFKVRENNGGMFVMENESIILQFNAEGRNGGLYWNVKSLYNKATQKSYVANKYLHKYISVCGGVSQKLAELNYLWDYTQQRPFLEAKIDGMQKVDELRTKEGKAPLYKEYLDSFDYSLIK